MTTKRATPPPPGIDPVPIDADRPAWSVMIPTYNSTELLETTLRCVLDQDPGRDRMQIAVVDDRSPNGRSREIVGRLAPDRVEFISQPRNVGLAGNWNSCVGQSRGRWVHILHQDDMVLPGFYERLGRADRAGPDIGAAFCRFAYIDGQGRRTKVAPIERQAAGVLEGWADRIAVEQRIQCPSIVVKREAYERLGGFRTDLRYTLDWEMWARIAFRYAFWYEPEVLACWRKHDGSETRRLEEAGAIAPDLMRGIEIVSGHAPASRRAALSREATRLMRWSTYGEVERLMAAGETGRALELISLSYRHEAPARRILAVLGCSRWAAKVWLRRILDRSARAGPIAPDGIAAASPAGRDGGDPA